MVAVPSWIQPELRARLGPPPQRDAWPTVSIVVPTRDGRALLERLLDGLGDRTAYDPFEVVVVDGGSTDGTLEWLASAAVPFPLRVLELGRQHAFAVACNRGAAMATGDRLLMLNNDVEPVEAGWLARLVTALEDDRAAIAGAVLVDPDLTSPSGRPGAVHHVDLGFRARPDRAGVLEPRPRGHGDDLADALGPDRPAPAVTAACALVRRDAFDAVGGLDEGYETGKEDVDLCLKLAAAGHRVVSSRSTVLLHRRGATRRTSAVAHPAVQDANLRRLLERWGPRLRRELALDPELWGIGDDPAPRAGGRLAYHVAATDGNAATGLELAAGLARTGAAAGTDAALLADVIVHLDGAAPPMPGRVNALVCPRRDWPPREELRAFDVALERAEAATVDGAVAEAVARRGGLARIARTRPRTPPAGRGLLVLGMARSGTSVATRLLSGLGVDVGAPERLMAPNAQVNAKGFYEHLDLVQINVALLKRLGGSWRDPPDLPAGWELDPGLDDLRERASDLLAQEFGSAPRWAFKDPRTCLTLPFWRPLVGAVDFVVCHRHPLEVADSLRVRDGLSLEQSLALWKRYTASAVAHTAGARRIFLGYHEHFDGRGGDTLRALATFVARTGAAAAAPDAEAPTWVEGGLRHHHRPPWELLDSPGVDEPVRTLFLHLELASRSRATEPALAGARGGGSVADALDAAARAATASQAAVAGRLEGLEERIAAETAALHRRRPVAQPRPPAARMLFVCGCPRSGTTALTTFLNRDDRVVLGQERFRRVIAQLEPHHFTEPVFFNPTLRETSWAMPWRTEPVFPGAFADYQHLRERWRRGGVQVLGDKAPYYHRHLDDLAERFPGARFVLLLRDLEGVARSYLSRARNPADRWPAENDHRLAVRDWNGALGDAQRFLHGPRATQLLVVPYGAFYSGAEESLERLYAFLGLTVSDAARARFALLATGAGRRPAPAGPLDDEVAAHLAAHGDAALEAEVLERAAAP